MCSIKTELGFLILYIHNEFCLCSVYRPSFNCRNHSLNHQDGTDARKLWSSWWETVKKIKKIKALDQLFTANYTLGYHDHYNPFTSRYSTLHYFCLPLWSLPFYLPDTPPFSSCQTQCFIPRLKDSLFLLCGLPVSCHPYLSFLQLHQSSAFHA